MPTNDEINAGFVAIQPFLRKMVSQFVPGFMQGQALQSLDSQEGRQDVVDGLRVALTAAEQVRARAAPPKASSPR